jgi:hypothetical protein
MSRTISTTIAGPFMLSLRDPLASSLSDNPLTITSAGAILSTLDGIDGDSGTAWVITNAGEISGDLRGINLSGGGSVTNKASGSISGGLAGVRIAGLAGTVTNAGGIYGARPDGAGIKLDSGGSVTNTVGGHVSGRYEGVRVNGLPGTVINAGAIYGVQAGTYLKGAGIDLNSGGGVTNRSGGHVSGYEGVRVNGLPGTVINAGAIYGRRAGIDLNSGGVVTNNAGGYIGGGGVLISGLPARVYNAGTISGYLHGIDLDSGDSVINEAGGLIWGYVGVGQRSYSGGGPNTVTNSGEIRGGANGIGGAFGIDLNSVCSITNKVGGSIEGVRLASPGSTGSSITNFGAIGQNMDGIAITAGGGIVTNKAGGAIQGGAYGVIGSSAVTNAGVIRGGDQKAGITNSGVITNEVGGLISGYYGIGFSSAINNTGTINGVTGIHDANSVTNNSTGTIYGSFIGIHDANSVTNRPGGVVIGDRYGIESSDTVTNAGSIIGGYYGIRWTGGVTNKAGGSISGGHSGVVSGGTVTNAGTISGHDSSIRFEGENSRLIIDPGAVFIGEANATDAPNSTIELANGSDAISGIGNGGFTGFTTLAADPAAKWSVTGNNTIATVMDNGNLTIAGTLQVTTSVDPASTGAFLLNPGGTLEVAAATGVSTQIKFMGGGELIVDSFANFGQNIGSTSYAGPLLDAFFGGAAIDLVDFAYGTGVFGINYNNNTGILELTNSASQTADLEFHKSSLSGTTFHVTNDSGSGVLLTRG